MRKTRNSEIYFDNAATTLHKPASVSKAMSDAVNWLASPGRGGHSAALRAAELAYDCRELAAKYFNVPSPENVVFTMNATHALNISIHALSKSGKRAVISGYEHNSVYRPVMASGAEVYVAKGRLFDAASVLNAFDKALVANTALCVVNHISNVFGFVQPVEKIAAMCRERRIPLIIDASQSAGVLPIDFIALGADFIAMPGHKGLYGPQGTGILLCRDNQGMLPLLYGGSGSESKNPDMPQYLPDRLEAGTHNMPGIAGLFEGLKFVSSESRIFRHEQKMLNLVGDGLACNGKIQIFRDESVQSGVLSFTVDGIDCETFAARLSECGVAVRAGQHCAPLAHRSAGTAENGTIRASFSAFNTFEEAEQFVSIVEQVMGA